MKFGIGQLKHAGWIALLALQSFGAEVTISVNPPIISLGESAQLKIEVRDAKRPKAPVFPRIDGLTFSGTGQSSQTSIVNGKMDKSISYTVTVYPQRTGDFTIGPIQYTVDKETKQLSGKLKVVATIGDAGKAQSWSDVVFAKMSSNRQKAYVQEPFELTLSVYSRPGLQIHGINNLRGLPETGLTVEGDWEGKTATREQVNGELFEVRRYTASIRPIGSGEFSFAPTVTVQVVAPQQQRRRRDPFFNSFFDRVQTSPVEVTAAPVSVEVLPLPNIGKPAKFSGAVGQFQLQVTAEPTEVNPGDPITLQMTIIGNGNFERVMPPALPIDSPFRLFGDAIREQGKNGVRFEQVISPRDATATEIPSIAFSYFDSGTGTYRTIQSPAIPITVTASSNNTAQVFAAQETLVAPPSNQPFATQSDVQRFTEWLKQTWDRIRPWLWTLPATLGVGILIFLARKFYHYHRKDTVRLRRQQAPKAARKALRAANKALHDNNLKAFYGALGDALTSYFGNRLNLTPGNVTPTIILTALKPSALHPDQLQDLQNIFEQLEAIRYGVQTQKQSAEEMTALKIRIEKTLRATEKLRL